jgi:hypothetical protein
VRLPIKILDPVTDPTKNLPMRPPIIGSGEMAEPPISNTNTHNTMEHTAQQQQQHSEARHKSKAPKLLLRGIGYGRIIGAALNMANPS